MTYFKVEDTPLVSVILITYNRECFLKETIDSILAQTYRNFELIIIDNFSDYDFNALVNSYHSNKIRAFQNQNNGIIAINRNFGIERARGNYLAFCDDDDIWYPNKLEIQVEYIQSHNIDLYSSALMLFGDGVESEKNFFHKYTNRYQIYQRNFITPSTVLVRNTLDVRFDEAPDFNCSEDWALWTKLITLGFRLYQYPEPLIKYRVFASNLTKQNRIQPDLKAIRILKKLKRECPKEFKNRYFLTAIIYHLLKCGVREFFKLIIKTK